MKEKREGSPGVTSDPPGDGEEQGYRNCDWISEQKGPKIKRIRRVNCGLTQLMWGSGRNKPFL